jgi:hypothetical protein
MCVCVRVRVCVCVCGWCVKGVTTQHMCAAQPGYFPLDNFSCLPSVMVYHERQTGRLCAKVSRRHSSLLDRVTNSDT